MGGPSDSRNRGIDEARGEWIALLDADDFFEADRLKKILDVAEREQADLVADNLIIVSEDGEALSYAFSGFGGRASKVIGLLDLLDMNRPLVAGVKLGYSKPLMRKDFLRDNELRYNDHIRVGEDFLLYGKCILKGGRFLLLREAGYCYRLVEGSVTRSDTGGWRTAQLLEANRCLMSSLEETADSDVKRLIARRGRELEALLLYIELVGLAKKGKWGQFVTSASRRVDLLPDVIRAAGRAIR